MAFVLLLLATVHALVLHVTEANTTSTLPASSTEQSVARWTKSSPPDGHAIYECAGHTVTFPWNYDLSSHDALCDVQWFYEDGNSTRELVAMKSHGKFVPLPEFSQRVAAEGRAGFSLKEVTVEDSGTYSVEVHVYTEPGDSHTMLQSSVRLVVSDQLMTTDGDLHVTRSPDAVLDYKTNQWSSELQCGQFIFDENPPFPVEWKTPKGKTMNSTEFQDGHFHLLLKNPISGGNYTCRIPSRYTKRACLPAHAPGEAAFTVDMVDSRLFLLEQESLHLKEQMQQTMTDYQGRLKKLEDEYRIRNSTVAFHATYLGSQSPAIGTPLIFTNVLYNQGKAYNSSTGYFVAPFHGLYYFISSTSSYSGGACHQLFVDSVQISRGYSYQSGGYQMSSVHGVVHLKMGQRVWTRSSGNIYWSDVSSFTGFLLSRDL